MIIHYSLHWSVVVIDNVKKKVDTYDSGVTISKYSHKKPHNALKKSMEDITGEQWNMEQILVPQQDEGESCGYRVLSNLSKIIKGQEICREKDKEHNRLYYYLEIAQTLKDNQIKRSQSRKRKRKREDEEKEGEELEQERMEEEHKQQSRKRNKEDNVEGKKQKRRRQEDNGQNEEAGEVERKRQKRQSKKDDETEKQEQGKQKQYIYSHRSGRFRVENMQPD